LLGFIAVASDFALRVRRARRNGAYNMESGQEMVNGKSNQSFKRFLYGKSPYSRPCLVSFLTHNRRPLFCNAIYLNPVLLPSCGAGEGV
jgi:hypothetical protein